MSCASQSEFSVAQANTTFDNLKIMSQFHKVFLYPEYHLSETSLL